MKELFIKRIKTNGPVSLKEAGYLLEKQTVSHLIDTVNWNEFDYKPNVAFRIGHTENEIWLKYNVSEKYILAKETKTNGAVYMDSCVEFFLSLDGENYYNCEFNCIGVTHLAYGAGRNNRKFVDSKIIKNIKIKSSLGDQPFDEKEGDFEWEMIIQIPIQCFAYSELKSLDNLSATANFYKCGDGTSKPHYISWNPIKTENPDYHRPEFFGKVLFE